MIHHRNSPPNHRKSYAAREIAPWNATAGASIYASEPNGSIVARARSKGIHENAYAVPNFPLGKDMPLVPPMPPSFAAADVVGCEVPGWVRIHGAHYAEPRHRNHYRIPYKLTRPIEGDPEYPRVAVSETNVVRDPASAIGHLWLLATEGPSRAARLYPLHPMRAMEWWRWRSRPRKYRNTTVPKRDVLSTRPCFLFICYYDGSTPYPRPP